MLKLRRVPELLVQQRTMLVKALRSHLAEFGVVTRPECLSRWSKMVTRCYPAAFGAQARSRASDLRRCEHSGAFDGERYRFLDAVDQRDRLGTTSTSHGTSLRIREATLPKRTCRSPVRP